MLKHCLYIILFSLSSYNMAADILQPFSTDGCSAFPEGTFSEQNLWLECCTQHDIAYWKGGTYLQRLQADEDLMICVSNRDETTIGIIMLVGVRVGGTPFIPTSFRWGYGWPYPKAYGELTSEENALIEKTLNKLP